MKKKILFVLDSLVMGGLEKSFVLLCDNLDYSKFDVDVYFLNDDRTLLHELNKNVFVYPKAPLYSTVYNLSVFKSICELLKRGRFDLAFYRMFRFCKARFSRNNFSKIDWFFLKKTQLKIDKTYDVAIGYQEGSSNYFVAECVDAKIKNVWIHTDINAITTCCELDKETFEKADSICTVSNNSKDSLMMRYPQFEEKYKVFTLPSLYDLNLIQQYSLESVNFQKDYINIVSVGTLYELKGFHFCVKACKRLIDDDYKVRWYIVGEGSFRKKSKILLKLAIWKVIFSFWGNKAIHTNL